MDATTQHGHRMSLPHTVTVDQPGKRLRKGGIHYASQKAIIARARRENPQYADAAVVEIVWGGVNSVNTVIMFDPTADARVGL